MSYSTEIEVAGTDQYGFLPLTNEILETNPTAIIDNELASCVFALGNIYDWILIATTNGLTISKKQDVYKGYIATTSDTTDIRATATLLTDSQISCVRFSPTEEYLAVGTKTDLRIYSCAELKLSLPNCHLKPLCVTNVLQSVQYFEWSNNSTEAGTTCSFLVVDEANKFHYCDFDATKKTIQVHRTYENVTTASWKPDGSCVSIGTLSGDVYLVKKDDLQREALSSPVSLPTLLEHAIGTCKWFEDDSVFISSLVEGQVITYIVIVNTESIATAPDIEILRILEYMSYQDVEPSGGGLFHLCYLPDWKILVPVYHNASAIDYILHYEEDTWKIFDMEDPEFAAFLPCVEETPQGAVGAVVDLQCGVQKMDPVENSLLGKSPVITMLTSQSRIIGMSFAKRCPAVDYPGVVPLPGFSFSQAAPSPTTTHNPAATTTTATTTTIIAPPKIDFTPIVESTPMFSFGQGTTFEPPNGGSASSSSAFTFGEASAPPQQVQSFEFSAPPSSAGTTSRGGGGVSFVQKAPLNIRKRKRPTPTQPKSSQGLPKFDFDQPPMFISRTPHSSWESNLSALYNHPKMYDFYFVLPGGEKLYCSRTILSSNSPVFKTMFESGFNESQNQSMEITEEMEHVQSFQLMIQYMYYKPLTITTADTICYLLETADKYEMRDLESHITLAITSGNEKFDISSSIVDLLTISNLTKNQKLHSYLLRQIIHQFDSYLQPPKLSVLLDLSFPQIDSLFTEIKLLGNKIDNGKLLDFILQWCKHDPSRNKEITSLLKCIQWSKMDSFFLLTFLDRPDIKGNVAILQGIIRGFIEEKRITSTVRVFTELPSNSITPTSEYGEEALPIDTDESAESDISEYSLP